MTIMNKDKYIARYVQLPINKLKSATWIFSNNARFLNKGQDISTVKDTFCSFQLPNNDIAADKVELHFGKMIPQMILCNPNASDDVLTRYVLNINSKLNNSMDSQTLSNMVESYIGFGINGSLQVYFKRGYRTVLNNTKDLSKEERYSIKLNAQRINSENLCVEDIVNTLITWYDDNEGKVSMKKLTKKIHTSKELYRKYYPLLLETIKEGNKKKSFSDLISKVKSILPSIKKMPKISDILSRSINFIASSFKWKAAKIGNIVEFKGNRSKLNNSNMIINSKESNFSFDDNINDSYLNAILS